MLRENATVGSDVRQSLEVDIETSRMELTRQLTQFLQRMV